ncbi:MAG: AAA family ATPase [Prochloraceae cyanobacterium]
MKIELSGYQTLDPIYQSNNSLVYRGVEQKTTRPVILKFLNPNYPSTEELTRYEQEYQITKNLKSDRIIAAYDLKKYQNTLVIAFEDFGGRSLDIIAKERKFTIEEFLEIAIKITAGLQEIHAANIIHKDINPANIVYNISTKEVKIIDFGIATRLPKENPTLKNPQILEGTLAYISPEQTGRINLALDRRTDFYSLGVTFYELLTNKRPFLTEDLLELLYCHLAKVAEIPQQNNLEIPLVLSNIVTKLMAKNPEERYQTAWGIKADLECCLQQLKTKGRIDNFQLASQDICDRLQISQKIYGRENEIETLLKTFKKVRDNENKNSAAVFISGYSGIGKSALVKEIYRSITEAQGYFISGKFDQYQKDIPYSAIVQAFGDLIEYLLVETEANLKQWQDKLLTALGVNGGVIIEVIPKLKLITGEVAEVAILPPKEAENRFNFVFKRFIKVFARSEHPLVIFLDDLQWADRASLGLIESILTELEENYLLLIGTYRDNEVSPLHPLISTVEEIEKAGVKIEKILLDPLKKSEINDLIVDSFNCSFEAAENLGELILSKTDGNPFFIDRFLRSLYAENLLYFNDRERNWEWDLKAIKKRDITENVVELLSRSIKKLNPEIQKVLQLAACIGDRFEIETLAIISQNTPQQTALLLREAIAANLIYPLGDAYKAIELGIKLDLEKIEIEYKFSHDRIQQAAYSLISPEKKPVLHWQIGKLLLANIPEKEREKQIFKIVNQLNLGRELIETQPEKNQLAKLNLIAGKKAKRSAAYQTAFNYLKICLALLDTNSWKITYDLSLEIYTEAAELAFLNGNLIAMEEFGDRVLANSNSLLDRVKIYEIKIQGYVAQNKLLDAVKIVLPVLKMLGINLPLKPSKFDILLGIINTKLILAGKNIESLTDLPLMKDPYKLAAMRILSSIYNVVYIAIPELLPLVIFKQIDLSIKYGNTSSSASAYTFYGLILSSKFEDLDLSYKFGKIGINLIDRFEDKKEKAKIILTFNFGIRHWKEHIKTTIKPFLEVYSKAMETGDLECSNMALIQYFLNLYSSGKSLAKISQKLELYKDIVYQRKALIIWYNFLQDYIFNLQENNDIFDLQIKKTIKQLKNTKQRSPFLRIHTYLSHLYYLFLDYNLALKNTILAEEYLNDCNGLIAVREFYFYNSLILLSSQLDKKQTLSKIRNNQKKMKKWAHHCPENNLNKYHLVEAEKYRVLGKKLAAIEHYDRAIALAKEYKFIQEEALANELAGRFYLAENKVKIAEVYLQDARYCYQKWGANAKVKAMEKEHSQFFSKQSKKNQTKVTDTSGSSSNKITSEDIDLVTIIKTSRSLEKEMDLDKLLDIILKFTIENVGAKTGAIILDNPGKQLLTAATERPIVFLDLNCENSDRFPLSLINYVRRTQENIILKDARSESIFSNDPYIIKKEIKSILCLPLLGKGKSIGVIYLENNLTVGAFTEERLEILKLISSQMAIAIENALLQNEKLAEIDRYQVGGCLRFDSPSYVIRQADRDLYNALKKGEFCYILNARQMGKSSLRVQMARQLETEGFTCISVDLTVIGNQNITIEQWYFGLIDELTYRLNLSDNFDCETWWESLEKFSPVQKLSKFIKEVLLKQIQEPIVIFIDEIDSISSLKFDMDDFFAFIRSLYNQRPDYPQYQRLTFVLLGVASPSNLIKNKERTPFNLGRAIALSGFKLHEIEPLAAGLTNKYDNVQIICKEILKWTGGQPFLTQKICDLILNSQLQIEPGKEKESIDKLVSEKIIANWEFQDEPQHLRTIRDRIDRKQSFFPEILKIYRKILNRSDFSSNNSPEITELLLSGLISQQQGKLKVYNLIYENVFNHHWIDSQTVKALIAKNQVEPAKEKDDL